MLQISKNSVRLRTNSKTISNLNENSVTNTVSLNKWKRVTLFAAILCVVLLTQIGTVSADIEADSDLVFDDSASLQQNKLEISDDRHRESWISHGVNRIKRQFEFLNPLSFLKTTTTTPKSQDEQTTTKPSISTSNFGFFNFFGQKSQQKQEEINTTEKPFVPIETPEESEITQESKSSGGLFGSPFSLFPAFSRPTTTTESIESNKIEEILTSSREKRASQEDAPIIGDDADEPSSTGGYEEVDQGAGDIIPDGDDEDLTSSGASGDHTDDVTTGPDTGETPQFYRMSFTIMEPYLDQFSETESRDFRTIAHRLSQEVENLFQDLLDRLSVNIISLERRPSDSFTSKVTLDIGTTDMEAGPEICDRIRRHIKEFRKLDTTSASLDDFQCRDVSEFGKPPSCAPHELPCTSGECLPAENRCDGVRQCSDGSDEYGCPTTTEATTRRRNEEEPKVLEVTERTISGERRVYDLVPPPLVEPHEGPRRVVFNDTEEAPGRELPAKPFPTSPPSPDRVDKCRADDKVRCRDQDIYICTDQECDGVADCPDGSDEEDCDDYQDRARGHGVPLQPIATALPQVIPMTESVDTCSADDNIKCPDHDVYICITQLCDDIPNCPDGSDEEDCDYDLDRACLPEEFTCDERRCISMTKRCDRVQDCDDGTDERDCPTPQPPSGECLPNEFRCNDGRCIPESKRCNFVIDCSTEGEDELNCPCTSTEFECDNKQCISSDRHCDGYQDCDDGSDERNCGERERDCPKETHFQCNSKQCITKEKRCNMHCDCWDCTDERKCHCPDNYFKCGGDETVCIPLSRRCNGVNDCYDRSDEENCPRNETCPPGTYQCRNDPRMCYDDDKICDGIYDCTDGSDETNCTTTQRCRTDQFTCHDGSCIDINRKCDNRPDCRNGEDETDCDCGSDEFRCTNGECISASLRCDAIPDCTDESDEDNCPVEEGDCVGFRCSDGTCVLKANAECDRVFDCNDGSDEENCGVCYPGTWRCQSGECINEDERCNGVPDCEDDSDEKNCTFSCPPDRFRCTNGLCLDIRRRCDGAKQCPDGSDELNCPSTTTTTTSRPIFGPTTSASITCTPYQFRCNDGECLAREFQCDGVPDCDDESDETNCPCGRNEFRCPSNQQCIPENQVCDERDDCPDGEDELNCPVQPGRCESNEFTCANGQCIPDYLRCDRRADCGDSSDERDCCKPNEFPCKSGECIPHSGKCNGEYQCADGSDEDPQICATPPPVVPPISAACRYGEWKCRSGECIPASAVCDSRVDCRDYSDEENCPTPTPTPATGTCRPDEFRCENGPCISGYLHCDGKIDCPYDSSDELDCPPRYTSPRPATGGLNLQTYPSSQVRKTVKAKQGEEVVFQCRDEGPIRARIRWVRGNNRPLPPGTKQDNYGRIEIPNVQLDHAGQYICEAIGHAPSEPGSQKTVTLEVEPVDVVTWRPPVKVCGPNESMCSNGDCIPTSKICDGEFDCTDGSDERCSKVCEPNEFRCGDGECILKTWVCDTEYDCNDKSDELSCEPSPPGAPCSQREFTCSSRNQCVPKSFQCDNHNDCADGSDEIGCSPIYFTVTPPPMLKLDVGAILEITCTAIGVPTPLIGWRRNWGYVPSKCTSTSVNGTGNLRCPDFQVEDQGAYSCEAITRHGFKIADPNAIVLVEEPKAVCPRGYFNDEARSSAECISCFCFGVAEECSSADLFTYQLPPPFGYDKIVGVRFDGDTVEIDPVYRGPQPNIISTDRYGLQTILRPDTVTNTSPYLALPDSFLGNQLKSYGGYIKYDIRYTGVGRPTTTPTVIITGNGYTLSHRGNPMESNRDNKISVQLFRGEWMKHTPNSPPTPATRGEIMMTLAAVDNILVKLEYVDSATSETTIKNIQMDSAGVRNTGQGRASYVEKCKCPAGYTGLSCEQCADGYERRTSGPWLGRCVKEIERCPPGTYGDPNNGIPCAPCPCPYTDSRKQYASTCSLRDGEVVCDCPPGYEGARCERCEPGYTGNPLLGDPCRPGVCDPIGSHSLQPRSDGQCDCKTLTTGPHCDRCKPDSFHLAAPNQFGCIACFCMGITRKCRSSNWYRDQISTVFTNSRQGFGLVSSSNKFEPIENVRINPGSREITYDNFPTRSPEVYYWSLPSRYLGDKVTSYGGYLKFTLRYEPVPGGQSSKNTAPDVELISSNDISLWYFKKETPSPSTSQTIEVPILEQYWQRSDGQPVDREHMLMALADLEAILIKATYTTNTRAASLISVSLDIAQETNRGSFSRALEVEQCTCPEGYRGLSCEDCDVGYTRSDEGLYLRACQPCDCNGHSSDCDPETGECRNCGDHTTGEHCDQCLPGYEGDPTSPYGCRYIGTGDSRCNCSKEGSVGDSCYDGQCTCKTNVEGYRCDQCRDGTFALSATNPSGCTECYCSGVTSQCHDSNFYIEQIPIQILDDNHGFTITDLERKSTIDSNFIINEAENEVGYRFPPGGASHKFWSLPSVFTGNKVTSYGGSLSYTIRFTSSPNGYWSRDQDIVIIGNGVTIFWSNNLGEPYPDEPNKISVSIATTAEWQRLDYRSSPRPATREDIMTVLSNVDAILIRATPYTNTEASYISDITLDTALPVRTGQHKATLVELCRCPEGYRGTSCEACETGYYRDIYDTSVPNGACKKCPCNGNEQSCQIGEDNEIICNCLPGFTGPYCSGGSPLIMMELIPAKVIKKGGELIILTCKYVNSQWLDIEFLEDDVVFSESYTTDIITVLDNQTNTITRQRQLHLRMEGFKRTIKCRVINSFTREKHGELIAKLYTEEQPTRPTTESPTPRPRPPGPPPPTIVVTVSEPVMQIVAIGGTVRFHCNARSIITSENVPVRWSKLGGEIPAERGFDDARGMLVITELRASDSGTYICQAEDAYQIVESRATLIVGGNEPVPPKVEISPPYVDVEEGEPVEFRCSATGNPIPLLRWRRIDKELNPRHEFRGGIFRIPYVSIDDQGEYRCAATNVAGTDEVNAIIYVRVRGGTEPPPTKVVQVRPSDVTTRSGNQFTLSCVAPPDPYNEFSWEKKPGQLSSDILENNGNLTVYNAQPEDSGVYSCMVRGTNGNVGVGYSRVTVIASSTKPEVKVEPEKQTIAQGSTTEIRCVVTGVPAPTVKWTKVGEEFGPHIQQIGDTLRITNADIRDRGVYVCVAKNEAGFSQGSTILEVERREPPQVELYPSSRQVVQMGGSALLQCHITAGIPTPKLSWERSDGRPMPREVEELTGGVLRFSGVTLETAGTYTCHARSEAGETSVVGTIEVQSIPTITITPNGEQIFLKEGEKLRLECRATGVPEPAVSWQLPESRRPYDILIHSRISPLMAVHEISQVRTEDEGVYTCVAKNDAGITEQSVQVIVEDNEVDRGPTRGDIPDSRDKDTYPPHDTSPTLNVSVGTKAEMRCRANQLSGDTTPIHLQWRRQGGDLPSNSYERNGTLYINNVQKDHEGVYSCVGYSPSGEILFTANTYLSVHELPHITLSPKRQIVRLGEDASILCQATGTPPIDISWSAIDREMPRSAYVRGGYLQFYSIQLSDAGLYRCTATSPTGTADSVAEVVVNEITRGPIISAIERNQEHPINSSITLQCDVRDYQGIPPEITWRREGRDLPSNARIDGSRLYLDRLQISDEGRYICQLPNGVSDYINLIVNRYYYENYCNSYQCRRARYSLIYYPARCYGCRERRSQQHGPYTPPSTLRPPVLTIEPSLSVVRPGDVLDLRCTGANPGSIITWSKGRGALPDNVQTSGATLRINGVRPDSAGLYTCETSDPSGNYNVDYILDVEEQQYDDNEPERQEMPKVTYAPRGTSVLMDCTTDLAEPVNYEWSRLRGTIRNPPSSAMLNIAHVNVNDADTYICKTSNYETSTEVRNILIVTGVVPYFAQAPLSYLAFKPLPDAYLKFIIEISFKPERPDGIILYNGHKRGSPDFISIFMQDGIPEFRFNCGSGTAKIRGDRPLSLGQWHTIKITRSRRQGFMYVDKQGPYQGLAIGKHQGLDLGEPLFIGGVPSYIEMAPDSGPNTGFVGCISRLVIEHVEHDLLEEAHESQGVTTCETCATSVCRNNGICQEAPTEQGFKCICPEGFSGLTCERTGDSCYPGICGTGRCVETHRGIQCQCPMNKTGDRCEETINISEPAFTGDAYIAYPTPKPKRLKMALRFNPATLKDGVLFYCGESEEGNGDFTSLAIKDRRLEFKIDTGTGPVTVRSDTELQPDNWVIVTAMKVGSEVRLMVGGEKPKSVKSTSHKMINLQTPLYVGGYDKQRISLNPSVGVEGGFEGCISGVEVSGENLEVITAATDSANVQDCSNFKRNLVTNNVNDNLYREPPRRTTPPPNPCRGNPCLNNGVCREVSATDYFCACEYGYSGVHCEIKPDICVHMAPCKNGGTCSSNETDYKCDCPLFYTGKNCEQRADFSTDVSFRGDGYLEINGNLLTSGLDHDQQQQIAIQFTTNSSDGLLLWYGQEPDVDGRDRDYLSLAIVGGYLEAAWNLESRPASILYDRLRVDDNKLHLAVFKRDRKYGTLTVDHSDTMVGESDSLSDMLHCKGNIYLGGTPNIPLMTGQRYTHGFNGCINAIEVQNQERTLDLGDRMIAISGVNVKACARDDSNYEDEDEDVGEDLVN